MKKGNLDIVSVGHICLDMIPSFENVHSCKIEDIFRPGSLLNIKEMVFSTGGPVANTGIGMKIFGKKVQFIAKVGDDQIGRIIIDLLKSYGKTAGIAISKGEASSYTIVLALKNFDRIFLHYTGTNDFFCFSDIDFNLVKEAKLFHLGYPPLMKRMYENQGEELALIFKKAKDSGVTTSLDMSLPDYNSPSGKVNWRKILKRTLPYVDMFLPSIEESFFTLYPKDYIFRKSKHPKEELINYIDPSEYSGIADEFISFGCKMVSLKSGFRGWYFRTSNSNRLKDIGMVKLCDIDSWHDRELWCPAFKIDKIASATGSGDASIAGFLSALLGGYKLEECLKYANGAGNQNLTQFDATSGLGTWDSLTKLVKTKDIILFSMKNDNWEWIDEFQIWEKKDGK